MNALVIGWMCTLTVAASLATQSRLTIPEGHASTEANGAGGLPWPRENDGARVQHIYDASHFTNQGVARAILIQKLSWRANGSTTATWTGGTYSDVTIALASAATDWTQATRTFAANYAADRRVVYRGPVTVRPSPAGGGSVPQTERFVEVTLHDPFLYDPTRGADLLIDLTLPEAVWQGRSAGVPDTSFGASVNPRGCTVWSFDPGQSTALAVQQHHAMVVELGYVDARGLWPSFRADPRIGGAGLVVRFTDTTFSSRSGGVVRRVWDFGDGSPPATGATVVHTYSCGSFSPRLTVADAQESKSFTRPDWIRAGLVGARFTVARVGGSAPLQTRFTDATTGPVASWLWDFGDGTTSRLQNPTHTYARSGTYDVRLTVTGPCNTDTQIERGLMRVRPKGTQCVETLFLGNNGLTADNSGNMFDLVVTHPSGIAVNGVEVSVRTARGSLVHVDLYLTPETFRGKEDDSSRWVKVSSGAGRSEGHRAGDRTPIDVQDFYVPPGRWGLYVVQAFGGIHYTTIQGNYFAGNRDLQLNLGIAKGALFGGQTFQPRAWNGAICYSPATAAAAGSFGFGCRGSSGALATVRLDREPALGANVRVDVAGMVRVAMGPAWLFVGGVSNSGTDLTPNGMPGCRLFVAPVVATLGMVNAQGVGQVRGTIPNDQSLLGRFAALQAANADAGANVLGVAASAGLGFRFGR